MVDSVRFNRLPQRQVQDRAKVFFKSLRRMRYAAVGVGAHEMAIGVKPLKKFAKASKMPLVATNIFTSEDEKHVFSPWLIKQVGGLRMCALSLVTESPEDYGTNFIDKGYVIMAPVKAAKRAVRELKDKRCDMIVVLSQLSRAEVDKVAEKVRGVDLVLGSTGQNLTTSLERINKAYFGDCFNKGKYVGELLITPGKDKDRFAIANLKGSLLGERMSLASRVRDISGQLEEADKPGGAIQLTDESRTILQQQLAALRAKLQRVAMELESEDEGPGDASLLSLTLHPLASDTKDDGQVLRVVERYKKKWKVGPPGH